jgi:hypothetical protein
VRFAIVVGVGAAAFVGPSCGAGADPDPVDVVAAWAAARNAGDIEDSMSLVADDARLFWYRMSDPDERAAWVEVLESQRASGWRIDEDCVDDGEWISCRYEQTDEMLRRWGLALRGTHEYSVRDGRIVSVDRRHDPDSERAVADALEAFRVWVETAHPDLVPVIWSEPGAAAFTDRRGAEAVLSLLDPYEVVRTVG